ncbi:lactate utilization protein C [Deinococcus psychrotolerans]|uniref:Lactate utilization protein C n=1 Tax=Deinococcus psychrotolerans TaxID=2489213 RepID=A0A3G8YBF0_9DEIO|nr:LUD domain-containing protein [Deinococcus psychrotolerans]AZI42709.1 lactate utilization protein C [Deinococcus psychrotolerans]
MSGEARLEMLTRIHRAAAGPKLEIERPPIPASTRPRAEIVAQFAEYAAEYRAEVHRASEADLPVLLAALLSGQNVLVPEGFPAQLFPQPATHKPQTTHADLAAYDAVLTTCAVAIAETGTVVLDHGAGQGRRALTLIPDWHVCVVRSEQVVDSVPEAVAALQEAVLAGRPLTWISGPSATSDIELSRVEGVHGPRRLSIIVVD